MQTRDQIAYDNWKSRNTDECSTAIFSYAERWADMMEADMTSGKKLEEIAKETSHTADIEGITGFMYGAAVSILAHCWIHGEALRIWHNLDKQIGNEGEDANRGGGVFNPAVMDIE